MMHEETSSRLAGLDGVWSVVTGPHAVTVYADAPAPFAEIAATSQELPVCNVVECTKVSGGAVERWRETNVVELRDRHGVAIRPDDARAFANHIGVIDAPTLNVRKGKVMGMVFATFDDVERYDSIVAGTLRVVSSGDFTL